MAHGDPVQGSESWLREVVAQTGMEGRSLTFERLAGHASRRTYWRVRGGPEASVVVMVLAPDAPSDEIGKAGPVGVAPFVEVQAYLSRIGVRVPAVLTWSQAEGFVVLEDLGDDMVVTRLAAGAEPGALYRRAVEQLAGMRRAAELDPDPRCIAFRRGYDYELYARELDHFLEWVLRAGKGVSLSRGDQAVVESHFEALARRLAAQPAGFTHRDYQSRNLMVLPGGQQVVIDFQDALLGPQAYDLVALLRDSYVRLDEGFIEDMIGYYHETSAKLAAPSVSPAGFRAVFDLLTIQRKLKDAGRFMFIDRVKGNPSFLSFVPVALDYAREAFARLPELAELQAVLGRHVPELAPRGHPGGGAAAL